MRNDVCQVLVVDNSKAALAAGGNLSQLTEGQIGVFDAQTHLAIDGTSPVREFYAAVGVSSDGSGVVDDIHKSSGQVIQTEHIREYTFRPHTPAVPMVMEVTDYDVKCNTDYTLKIEFRNQEILRRQGMNQFSRPYSVKTGCCTDCGTSCEPGNVNELTQKLVAAINFDVDDLVLAEPIATEAITIVDQGTSADYAVGDVISDADLQVLVDFNEAQADETTKVKTGLRLTSRPLKVQNFAAINVAYYHPRGTELIVSMVEGFDCTGTLTVVEEGAFEEGNGYDVQQREYMAGGWNGRPGPYRVHSNTGLAKNGIEYFADRKAKYDIAYLCYGHYSQSGWGDYMNDLGTEFVFDTTDGGPTTGRDSFLTVIDRIVAARGFDALADDAAASNDDPTVSEPTEDAATQDLDGIA